MTVAGLAGRRILFVTPRYHASIVGGADQYTRALAWELARAGARVRVLTTRTRAFEPRAELGIGWPDELPGGEDLVDGIVVRRFGAWSPPTRWAPRASQRVRERVDSDIAEAVRDLGRLAFGAGWYAPEPWGADRWGRWSNGLGQVALPAVESHGVTIKALSLVDQPVRVFGVSRGTREPLGSLDLPRESWSEQHLSWAARSLDALELEGGHRFVPGPQDSRTLSFVASRIALATTDGTERVLDARDASDDLLDALDDASFARVWVPIVERRSHGIGLTYAALRGPLSPGLALACLAEARDSDAIIASGFPFLTLRMALTAGRLARVPVYALPFFHDRDPTHHWRHLYTALRGSRATLALSRFHAEHIAGVLGARTLYVGASSPHWSVGGALPPAPAAPPPPSPTFRVAFVGRLTHSKGVATAVAAVRKLRELGHDVRLCVIGPDESHGVDADDAIERLGTVPVDRLQQVLGGCDALALPSRHESFGLVIIEAWAVGRPVLADAAAGSLRTLVSHGVDGFLCSGVDDYAARIAEWIADRERCHAMGEAGRAKVETEHRWEHVIARLAAELGSSKR